MTLSLKFSQVVKTAGPSLGIVLICAAILMSPIPETHPEIYTGIVVDLCLLSPLLALVMGRFLKTTPYFALPFLAVGYILCYFLIPREHQKALRVFQTAVLPLVEIGVLFLVGYKTIRYVRILKKKGARRQDGISTIREAIQNSGLPPALTGFLTTELSVFYYALWAWKRREQSGMEFSMYQESGQIPVCLGLMMIVGIETAVLHRLLIPNYAALAWVLTILSTYTAFYFLAHLKALWLRPTTFTPDGVWFKNGLLGETHVPFESIEKFDRCTSIPADLMNATGGLGLKSPPDTINFLIYFSSPQVIRKPYGQKKAYRALGIYIDLPSEFEKKLQDKLEHDSPRVV